MNLQKMNLPCRKTQPYLLTKTGIKRRKLNLVIEEIKKKKLSILYTFYANNMNFCNSFSSLNT